MVSKVRKITVLDKIDPQSIPEDIFESTEPILLKGLVDSWPIVEIAKKSKLEAANYLRDLDVDIPMTVYVGEPEIKGRIFYNQDFTGFNFDRTRQTLGDVLDKLFETIDSASAPLYYIGSTMIDHWLPGFRGENDINLGNRDNLMSLWLGNKSRIAAHYDFPNNIACSIIGRRRVTLFPPNQADNLYIGPLDFTPSGQAISLVDSCSPDYDKFPKYANALKESYVVELEEGDALFIPSMWWHHIEALESFNALVNYWWRSTPVYLGSPQNALHHAIMALRDLPTEQRNAWKDIFDQYIFEPTQYNSDHIPDHAKGLLSHVDEDGAKTIRSQLVKFLNV